MNRWNYGGLMRGAATVGLVMLAGCEQKVTIGNYNAITVGMTYTQVVSYLGEGELISSSQHSTPRAVQNMLGDVTAAQRTQERQAQAAGVDIKPEKAAPVPDRRIYRWPGPQQSEIIVEFVDDAVVQKSQRGLE